MPNAMLKCQGSLRLHEILLGDLVLTFKSGHGAALSRQGRCTP